MKRLLKILTLGLLLAAPIVWAAVPSPPEAWNNAGYEARPGATDSVSEGDDQMRGIKTEIRTRLETEMEFGTDNGDDNGLLRLGSARTFNATAAPTDIDGPGDFHNDGGGRITLLTTDGDNGTIDIGAGRLWVDTDGADGTDGTDDDDQLWFYEDVNGWKTVKAPDIFEIDYGDYNVVYNGDFEIDGDAAGDTNPVGWTETDGGTGSSGPTVEYNDNTGGDLTEGPGLRLVVTGDADADGSDSIDQRLDGLKASTTYTVVARVKADSGFECVLDVAGEDSKTGLPDTTATTTTFETLTGEFTTTVTPADVTVNLQSDPDTGSSICSWDHIGVFEKLGNDRIPVSRGFLWTLESSSTESETLDADRTFDDLDSPVFEITSDNCYARVEYDFGWTATDADDADDTWDFVLRLQYRVAGGAWTDLDEGWSPDQISGLFGSSAPPANPSNNNDVLWFMNGYGANDSTTEGDLIGNQHVHFSGAVGNLNGGDSFETQIAVDVNNAGSASDTIVLDPAWRTSDEGALTTSAQTKEHRASVELVCH